MTKAVLQLLMLYAQQVLSIESKINGEEEVRSSAGVYVNVLEAIEVRKRPDE